MKRQLLLLLLLLTAWGSQAQRANIQVESFEVPVGNASSNVDAANTTIYTFAPNVAGTTATSTKDEYFQRWVSSADPSGFSRPVASGSTGTFDGTYYWAGEGVRGPAGTSSIVRAPGIVTLKPASIVGKGSLQLTVSFYDGEVAQGRTPWETNDVFMIQANIDGMGWNTIGQFAGNATTGYMRQDTNLDGSSSDAADASSREWTSVPADYTFAIAGSGSSIQVRIVASQQGSTEEFAFDNIRLSGVGSTNVAPTLTAIETTPLAFTEGGANAQITNTLMVSDADNTTLVGATVQFTAGFDNSEDRLFFINQNGITGSYNVSTGVLTLTGSATLTAYQAALRSVQYQNSDAIDASPATRTVAFTVTDTGSPAATSLAATRQITVATHLDAAAGLPYTESFDTDGEGARYGSNHFYVQDGIQFLRTSDNPRNATGGPTTFMAATGGAYASPYWFGENTASSANPATVKNGMVTTRQLDATGYVNLQFSILLGASNTNQGPTSSATTTWTTADYFKLYYRVGGSSGSWVAFDSYRGTGTGTSYGVLKRDTDPNAAPGSAAPTGATLTPLMTAYTTALPVALNEQLVEFRAVLVNSSSNNDFAFDQLQVTGTPIVAPTVTTAAATSLATTSATLGGNVTSDGGATVMDRGIVYSTTNTVPTTSNTKVPMGTGTGIYAQAVAGLLPGTMYYVRAYALNKIGTSYGGVVSFTTLPNTPVVTSPANGSYVTTTTPTYTGTAQTGSTVTVYVDGAILGTTTAAGGSFSLNQNVALASGAHTVQATATVGGSVSAASNSSAFTVDVTAAETTLGSVPSNPSNSAAATFTFSGTDAGGSGVAYYEASLDGAAFATATSPLNYAGLADGAHTFRVRAIDNAGNVDATPAAYSWAINTAPLPVTLVSFTAAWQAPAVQLAWRTTSEVNSTRFEVERSLDGSSFTQIGQVAAAGSSATSHTYAYPDASAPTGRLYYRLRQVDLDGTAYYSPVRTVTRAGGAAGLTLFPNPTRTQATLAGANPNTEVQVSDALGRLVLRTTADAAGTAPLVLAAGLLPGVYVVRAGSQALRLVVE